MEGLLSKNNIKLGKIAGFAISTKSCSKYRNKKYQGCKEYCYAKKIETLRPKVKAKWERNLKATKRKDFVERMCKEITFVGDYIRVHVSGDFYSQLYLDKWIEIANRFKHKKFLIYTKAIDLDYSKRPRNFRVLLSDDRGIWAHLYVRFDGVATMWNRADYFTCPYVKEHATCQECLYCYGHRPKVYFIKH